MCLCGFGLSFSLQLLCHNGDMLVAGVSEHGWEGNDYMEISVRYRTICTPPTLF